MLFFQVEKAFREGTARQNAHSIFVCLALKLLEERVHVACKDIITLEKQVLNLVIFKDKTLGRKTRRAIFSFRRNTSDGFVLFPTDEASGRGRKRKA